MTSPFEEEVLAAIPREVQGPLRRLVESARLERFCADVREQPDTDAAIQEFFGRLSESSLELFGSFGGSTFDDGTPNVAHCKEAAARAFPALDAPVSNRIRELVLAALEYAGGFSILLLAQADATVQDQNHELAARLLREAGLSNRETFPHYDAHPELAGDSRARENRALDLQRAEFLAAVQRLWDFRIQSACRTQH